MTQDRISAKQAMQRRESRAAADAKAAAIAAKERRQQTLVGALAMLIVVALVAVISVTGWTRHNESLRIKSQPTSAAYHDLQTVAQKPTNATNKAGLYACKKADLNAKAPTVEIYLDFMCPSCGELNRTLDSTLEKMNKAHQINIEVHPVTFLDGQSSDHYSLRTASAAAYIADNDPDHLMGFVSELFAKDFQPSETAYKPVSDDQIICQAVKAGIDKTTATKAMQGTYAEYMDKANTYTTLHRPELCDYALHPQGGFGTPLIRVNNHIWSLDGINYDDLVADFEHGLGIKSKDVGNHKVLPSVGANEEPRKV
ncbi:thioredoxin domain-containing protein [Bifidobacterium sp. ESL0798]|uniref:DsbA family protein n=1 Tax=Bifidobacterium sp. ESL0798 TaxID=2983235 RepID=UPI0023F9B8A3|nr:thioredoxin domain-containing protein [Bifidobacterium sp. ESL0798]WEV73458.1 thioredoxin domain-containing protein [Bifidobacterium sp. ESL0798]